jgi:hypothetical protein
MMTFEMKAARLQELATEMAAIAATIEGVTNTHANMTNSGGGVSLTFDNIDRLKSIIPADALTECGPSNYGGSWTMRAYATVEGVSCSAADKVEIQVVRKVAEPAEATA